jgi:multiple sugar transport system substrate-binding protein
MFKVKDFWAVPEYAELLTQLNQRLYPSIVGGEGSSQDVLDGLAADWKATFAKYGRGM